MFRWGWGGGRFTKPKTFETDAKDNKARIFKVLAFG